MKSVNCFSMMRDDVCSLQQGYECTRRFLTEFIASLSSDGDVQQQDQHNHCSHAASLDNIAQNDVQSSLNQTLTELGKLSTSFNAMDNSEDDIQPWCPASRQEELSCGLDVSFSDASVLETEV